MEKKSRELLFSNTPSLGENRQENHLSHMQRVERLSTIHRNLVVSYDKGELLGHVINAYFEKSSCSIKGLSIAPKLIKAERELFVSFQDIHRLGKSVVIVSSQSDLKKPPERLAGSSLRDLKKTKVATEDGEHLGELLDVNVFAKSGIISEIVLYGSKKLKIDVEKDKISIGPDMIVVPSGYQNRIEAQKDSDKNRLVANAGRATRSVAKSIKNAVLGVGADKAKESKKAPAKKKPGQMPLKTSQPKTASNPKSNPSPADKKAAKKPTANRPKKGLGSRPEKKGPGK